MSYRHWLFTALFLAIAWLGLGGPRQARATTIQVQECAADQYPCVGGNVIDSGIRTNSIDTLGANQFSALSFVFTNADVTFSGTLVAADIFAGGTNYIYLYGQGVTTQNNANKNFWIDVAISQNYLTAGGNYTFGAFNSAACNGAANAAGGAGDGENMQPFVDATALGGGSIVACPNPTQSYPGQNVAVGAVTNLSAAAIMQFSTPVGAGAAITLPWGDDLPDPTANALNNAILGDSVPTVVGDLSGLGLTAVPEPASLPLLAASLVGLATFGRSRKGRKN